MLSIGGWKIFAHPLLLGQIEKLANAVERERAKNPAGYQSSASAKLLAASRQLLIETIPEDPMRPEYRQGATLGPAYKHWFRAKFGNGRFRLFFRYHSEARIIVYAWMNDEGSLRTYGARTDAYAVFRRMLDSGNPPDDWNTLLAAASAGEPTARLVGFASAPPSGTD